MAYNPPRKNIQYIFYIGLISQATGQLQANPTIATGDFKCSTDGGAFGNLGTLPAVTPAGSKAVKVTLSTSEMNGDNVVVIGSDAAGAEWNDIIVSIQPSIAYSSDGVIDANAKQWLGGTIPAVNVTGVPKVDMIDIDGAATNGNNATLNLKQLNIVNNHLSNAAVYIQGTGGANDAVYVKSNNAVGIVGIGSTYGMTLDGDVGLGIEGLTYDGIELAGVTNGLNATSSTGKSINAPNDIAVSDGDLTLAAISGAVWGASPLTVKKNTALADFPFVMTDTSGVPATGLTVSATRRIDSGSFAACANSVTELADGWYTIDLDATDTNGTTIALRFSATGAADTNFTIVTQP